jgi:hypothetical protein
VNPNSLFSHLQQPVEACEDNRDDVAPITFSDDSNSPDSAS